MHTVDVRVVKMFSVALVMVSACEEPLPSVAEEDEYCAVLEIMDEYCLSWRDMGESEESAAYQRGCWDASLTVASNTYGNNFYWEPTLQEQDMVGPDADACLD